MFGRGRFNRCRFDAPEISNDYEYRELLAVTAEAGPAIGEDIRESGEASGAVSGRGTISPAVQVAAACSEETEGKIAASDRYVLTEAPRGTVHGAAAGTANCLIAGTYLGAVLHRSREVGNEIVAETQSAAVRNRTKQGADYTPGRWEVFEIANARVGTTEFETEYMTVSVSIPPGGEMVIDGGTYTVLLDGENVLWAQSGDWSGIDKIDRKTTEIGITAPGTDRFEVTIEYRERYL